MGDSSFITQIEAQAGAMLSDAIFGDKLDKLVAKKPEAVKEILVSWETETRRFIDETGQINRDRLRKELTITEKFSLMAQLWIAENISDKVLTDVLLKGTKIETSSFDSVMARVKLENPAGMLNDNNIFWPTADGLMGTFTTLMQISSGSGQADMSKLNLVTGSTLVLPKGEDENASIMGVDFSAALRLALLKHGIDLKSFSSHENIPVPGDKEIQLVLAPKEGLPMKDGHVDIEAVKAYAKLFVRGKTQWFTNPLLMAAVLVVKEHDATKVDEIMAKFGLAGQQGSAELKEMLTSLNV